MNRSTVSSKHAATALVAALAPLPAAAAAAAELGRGLPVWLWLLLLPPMIALGLGLHAAVAAAVKQGFIRWAPLARGEARITGYERAVHDSVERPLQAVLALALIGGAALWVGAFSASTPAWAVAAAALSAAIALDLALWQRVEVGDEHVWFQRGLGGSVHQVLIENIRDVSVEHAPAPGLSLRHGKVNATVRIRLRMKDRFVAALPKTGSAAGRETVAAVARHVDERLASLRAEAAMRPVDADRDFKRALKRLRRNPTVQAI